MDKKFRQQLLQASLSENELDVKIIEEIAVRLTRGELKVYIKLLKQWIKRQTVYVEIPHLKNEYKEGVQKIFPDKKIVAYQNPSLLLGMKIQDNDDIYEISLRNTLKQITEFVTNL